MIEVNGKHTNKNIKANILPDDDMKALGFTDHDKKIWYYCKSIAEDITFNVIIPKDGSDIEIITIDECYMQPYDYQYILARNPGVIFANEVKEAVEMQMSYLQNAGILSGHCKGEYI